MRRNSVIGERKLLLKRKSDRSRLTVTLRIGRPYWVKKNIEAACDVEAKGLFDDLHGIHGVDTLQALELATGFMTVLLKDLSSRYTISWPDGRRYSLPTSETGRRRSKRSKRATTQRSDQRTRSKST